MRFNEFRVTLSEGKGMDWGNFSSRDRTENNRAVFIKRSKKASHLLSLATSCLL